MVRQRFDEGFSIAEVLVGLALTVTVILTLTSFLVGALKLKEHVTFVTDYYESLRQVTSMVTQDARSAFGVTCNDEEYLALYTAQALPPGTPAIHESIIYRFAAHDIGVEVNPYGGSYDQGRLHRWVVQGGLVVEDQIVGWDLLDTTYPYGTRLGCSATNPVKWIRIYVVKAPTPAQWQSTEFTINAVIRNYPAS